MYVWVCKGRGGFFESPFERKVIKVRRGVVLKSKIKWLGNWSWNGAQIYVYNVTFVFLVV